MKRSKMKTELNKQNLELCFTEYENLQELHLNVLKTEPMPDIARMTEDRDIVFNRLKQNINAFVENAGSNGGKDNLPALADFETRLTSIMAVSEELSEAIMKYRENIKIDLAKMQQGKAAMRGYKAVNLN
jgi:glutamate synthase domain-containing protein 3